LGLTQLFVTMVVSLSNRRADAGQLSFEGSLGELAQGHAPVIDRAASHSSLRVTSHLVN
jgi:hypothetical protein